MGRRSAPVDHARIREQIAPAATRRLPDRLTDVTLGDVTQDGEPEVVVSFRRPFKRNFINVTRPRREWTDKHGLSAHLGLYRPEDLSEIWVAGTLVRPVVDVAACDGALAVAYGEMDGTKTIATVRGAGSSSASCLSSHCQDRGSRSASTSMGMAGRNRPSLKGAHREIRDDRQAGQGRPVEPLHPRAGPGAGHPRPCDGAGRVGRAERCPRSPSDQPPTTTPSELPSVATGFGEYAARAAPR